MSNPAGLTKHQIAKILNQYIGGSGGYLGDFSYKSHAAFYTEFCDLPYDPDELGGTTRERFIEILSSAPPGHQAEIVRGVTKRFPVGGHSFLLGGSRVPKTRTAELQEQLLEWASLLETQSPIHGPVIATGSTVERALKDVEVLVRTSGAPSAVDRIHTALHGYLSFLCQSAGLVPPKDASITVLFKELRANHPDLKATGNRASDVTKILRSSSAILDALNPLRNHASVAHPNPHLLAPAEAMLVVNIVRSLLHYIKMRTEA